MSDLRDALERCALAMHDYAVGGDSEDGALHTTTLWMSCPAPECTDALAALSGVPEGAASEAVADMDRFLGWLFRDGGAEPPRREYDDVQEALAALLWKHGRDPVPSPEPLDVERLARALHAMPHHYRGGADNDLARMACEQMSPSACEHKAASIDREYARLAAPQPVPEDET